MGIPDFNKISAALAEALNNNGVIAQRVGKGESFKRNTVLIPPPTISRFEELGENWTVNQLNYELVLISGDPSTRGVTDKADCELLNKVINALQSIQSTSGISYIQLLSTTAAQPVQINEGEAPRFLKRELPIIVHTNGEYYETEIEEEPEPEVEE